MSTASQKLKDSGNNFYAQGDFASAIQQFTKAIELDPNNHFLYSNRSGAFCALKKYDQALIDANKTVDLAPSWSKSYSRLASALTGLKKYDEATSAVEKGLSIEPANQVLLSLRNEIEYYKSEDTLSNLSENSDLIAKIKAGLGGEKLAEFDELLKKINLAKDKPNDGGLFGDDPKLGKVFDAFESVDSKNTRADVNSASSSNPNVHSNPTTPSNSSCPPAADPQNQDTHPQDSKNPDDSSNEIKRLKDLGNAAYRKRDFDAAMANYTAAWELSAESEPSLLTNMAAVHFEREEWELCIARCKAAVDLSRSNHSGFALIARAYLRMGRAYAKMDDLDAALKSYRDSLCEHRSAEVLEAIYETEKLLTARQKAAYQDQSLSDAARERGNQLFSKGCFAEAVAEYTEAIKRSENDVRAYANRSACYHKLCALQEAIRDADKCIEINPKFVKGYIRKANVLLMKNDFDGAIKECDKASKMNVIENLPTEVANDPDKASATVTKVAQEISALAQKCYSALNARNHRLNDESMDPKEREAIVEEAMRDPEVSQILSDPIMTTVLKEMQNNPKSISSYLSDPTIAAKIRKLVSAGIISTR